MAKNSSQVRAQNKKTLVKRIRSRWQLYLLLLLPLAWLIIFAYVPMGGLVIAFKKYNVRQGIWGSEGEAYFHYLPEKQPQIFLQMENCSSTFMCGQQFGRLPDIVQLFI